MGNIIALILVIGIVVTLGMFIHKRRSQPDKKLLKDFLRLKRSILGAIEKSNRKEAKRLLDSCESHLEGLLRAKEQQILLQSMSDSAGELAGRKLDVGVTDFNDQLSENLKEFFSSLSRIATVVGFESEKTVSELRVFTVELEERRELLSTLIPKGGRS